MTAPSEGSRPVLLDREQLLAGIQRLPPPREEVDVPGVGVVLVRGLTLRERDGYEAAMLLQRGKNVKLNQENIRAKLLVMCVINAAGEQVFKEDDATALGGLPALVLEPVFQVAQRLSGLSSEDVEELAGN